jgi:hypothetical protein
MKKILFALVAALTMASAAVDAENINEKISIGGVIAGSAQCQQVSDAPGFGGACGGGVPFQTEVSVRPTQADEVFVKLGFAAGNGLNGASPFVVGSWAADLEDDVKNINGRNRDYLLTAWYKHTFSHRNGSSTRATFGIIDATDYLDENAFANDEYTQFSNPALTNGPNVFLPSYDVGAALEWSGGPWSMSGVVMNIGENDDGNNFSFVGLQAGYKTNNRFGEGNYRFVVAGANAEFLDPTSTTKEARAGGLISADQQFGHSLGGFLRLGWQTDDAAVDYKAIYSGGIDIKGSAWGRSDDNIGLGYAYLVGGNTGIAKSQIFEGYYRWQIGKVFGLTADIQYLHDDYIVGSDPRGTVFGLRATAEF